MGACGLRSTARSVRWLGGIRGGAYEKSCAVSVGRVVNGRRAPVYGLSNCLPMQSKCVLDVRS